MRHTTTLSAALLVSAAGTASASLLVNGGFESGTVAGAPIGHGFTPAPWTSSAPGNSFINWDTFENTGTTGLPPSYVGLFTGATAPQGVRFAGGWDFEEMGQLLGSALTPGQSYSIGAWVRPINAHPPSSFEFYIGTGPGSPVSLVATFPMVSAGSWTPQSTTFVAPLNAAANPWFIIKAYSIAADGTPRTVYVGIDDVVLDLVPAPGSAALLGIAGVLVTHRRRR